MLVAAREEAGVTQQELAEKIGWTQTDISKVERGVRRLDLIEFLEFTKALGIDVQSFVERLKRD
jgi:transcriptional regulator with XRE-family HTH domain